MARLVSAEVLCATAADLLLQLDRPHLLPERDYLLEKLRAMRLRCFQQSTRQFVEKHRDLGETWGSGL